MKSKYQVPNLERALKIMEFLSTRPSAVSMAEITRELGYPNNSVFRIVSTLEEYGYLNRDPQSKEFRLSRKLLSLGYQALVETSVIEKSSDLLRSLRDKTGETALLGTLLDGEGVVLEQMPSTAPIKFTVSPGTRFALHTAAPAKAILAFSNDDEVDRQIGLMQFTIFTRRTLRSADGYRKILASVRKTGYATDCEEESEGVSCLAAPIFDYRGHPIAAIWITGPTFRLTTERLDAIASIVIDHASAISVRLGFQDERHTPSE